MTDNIIRMPQRAKQADIDEQALHWLMELDRGDMPAERKKLLQTWLAKSPAHKDSFLAHAKLWDELDVMAELADIIPYQTQQAKATQPKYYLYAASVLIACFMLAFLTSPVWLSDDKQPQIVQQTVVEQIYTTSKGEMRTFVLADGSEVTLNTDSQIVAKYDQNYRNIELVKGELHIKVAHNQDKPLNILVEDKMIQAVGTAFNVQYLAKSEIELIVSEGKVMLADSELLQDKVNFAKMTQPLQQTLLLKAGQKVAIDSQRSINSLKTKVEDVSAKLDINLSWLSGSVTFSGEPMAQAIEQVNRYLQQPIYLADEEVKNIRVIGRFEHGKLDSFLQDLERNFNVSLVKNAQGEIYLSKK